MKVLACLQILGRGNVFDDIGQMSGMSIATANRTFHTFCKRFASELFQVWIKMPTGEDLKETGSAYKSVGFPGAVGSTDVTHVAVGRMFQSHSRIYTGKEGYPALAYEATVDHSMRVVAATKGYPGTVNDKTIVRFDTAVLAVREADVYKNMSYKLRRSDGSEFIQKGAYLLVDGGYHRWASMMCPIKHAKYAEEIAWSKRLESVRKDVECFFGVLKGRFRILKLPIFYKETGDVDKLNVFWTCCILHNMLHSFDGLGLYEADVSWAGPDGCLDTWVHSDPTFDYGDKGSRSLAPPEVVETDNGFFGLRHKLVAHFDYESRHNNIAWRRS